MNYRRASYWAATTLIAFAYLTGGAAYLAHAGFAAAGVAALGYPAYFLTFLGAWKILGALAILAPGFPRLKEWAYAGIAFNLTGAAFSHAATGAPAAKAVAPLLLLGIATVSWATRPGSRTLAARPRGEDPAPAKSGSRNMPAPVPGF